jgi:hypothetical protein
MFRIRFPSAHSRAPLDGRLLLLLSADPSGEPRFQISDDADTQQIFGRDVVWLAPDTWSEIGADVLGYPVGSLRDVPAGRYTVQALLHRYETFQRSDGHTLQLPMDRGEGQQWNRAPGNLYSSPRLIDFDPRKPAPIEVVLDQRIPALPDPPDTRYVQHIRIFSERLSRFWGRSMYLGAVVLLPEGFDAHPKARYPLVIDHGHFSQSFWGFREEPPDPDLPPEYSKRFAVAGYNRMEQELAHQLFLDWTSADFPRVLLVRIQHANPYYDDSYAVNSANLGPYGDAITYDLVPELERRFRGIGEPWARFLYGGSTGGWAALAAQIFYPDEYNGCYAACPDPVDFRSYGLVNVYEHENAYVAAGRWKRTPRAAMRDLDGEITATLEQVNQLEMVLGTRGRSGGQWDIWEAVFSPVGPDGYPRRIWDKRSGAIDREVAEYWRKHYDLRHILHRDWAKLGPRLRGKLHLYCGDMDNFFLNNAVLRMEELLRSTADPHYDGEVQYGRRAGHCWNGDPERPNHVSRLRYPQLYLPKIMQRIERSAPAGADLQSWRY